MQVQTEFNLIDTCESYKRFFVEELIKPRTTEALFSADFVFASHIYNNDFTDPKFVFGNQRALDLWELSFEEFVGMPSKFSAEAIERQARAELLKEVEKKGYIQNYNGIRISAKGKRFMIKEAKVWNVYDKTEKLIGQAVKFDQWEYL